MEAAEKDGEEDQEDQEDQEDIKKEDIKTEDGIQVSSMYPLMCLTINCTNITLPHTDLFNIAIAIEGAHRGRTRWHCAEQIAGRSVQ